MTTLAAATRTRTKPIIQIQDVVKKFGDFTAVNGVSLTINQGELFSLLGGSGCGKSTLLRMIAGFEQPTSGRILIDGQDIGGLAPYERPVNMMFQSYALFPHMTVEQNIAFGLKQDGLPRAEVNRRVAEMLELVELGRFAKRKPQQLSGGQRQRVALARSLAKRPKVLLLDEPLSALDKKLRERTQLELVDIQEELDVTFVMVTHDQEEAMTMSTRVAVMDAGEIIQIDNPHAMYEYPNSRFVAEFFGTVNMFEGVLDEDEADYVTIQSPEISSRIYVSHGIAARQGQTVWVAVRPEKVFIGKDRPAATDNVGEGKVTDIVYLGGISTYMVTLDTGKMVRVTVPNVTRQAQADITWEDRVWIHWNPDSSVVVTQ
ncbi:ABC transporter ATP-binding protein [Caenispirillum salinarum]|uniref:ABC transporter ATP-binding protein n=1 Tax=Caenispirillum salinarum TaxID=859058 RepID=UPI00384F8A1C